MFKLKFLLSNIVFLAVFATNSFGSFEETSKIDSSKLKRVSEILSSIQDSFKKKLQEESLIKDPFSSIAWETDTTQLGLAEDIIIDWAPRLKELTTLSFKQPLHSVVIPMLLKHRCLQKIDELNLAESYIDEGSFFGSGLI